MRVTRKALEAKVTALQAQLAVHDNVTRASLNRYVRDTTAKNTALEATVKDLNEKLVAKTLEAASLREPAKATA